MKHVLHCGTIFTNLRRLIFEFLQDSLVTKRWFGYCSLDQAVVENAVQLSPVISVRGRPIDAHIRSYR